MSIFDTITALFSGKKTGTTKSKVVVRIAPSPTGTLHVGTARTALINYLFAKKNGGKFILRVEDTDKARSKKEYENNIVEGLTWLGLAWSNETIYRQSERTAIYKLHLEKMITDGTAYISKEAPNEESEDAKEQRSEVIRFKNPNTVVTFTDVVRGEISFDTTELGDFVIAKSLEEPLYHLTVVVDDFEMHVSHVIRGEDHISNTPRQILLQEALGAPRPVYAHLPLLLGPDKSKLSKRHGAKAVTEYKELGYLPEAMVNYLALLGWNPGTDEEHFTIDELATIYDLEKTQKGGAVFSQEKLDWFNHHYITKLTPEDRLQHIKQALEKCNVTIPDTILKKLEPVLTERINTFNEIAELHEAGELAYYTGKPSYEYKTLHWKKAANNHEAAIHLAHCKQVFETAPDEAFTKIDSIKALIWEYAELNGKGNVLWPLRYTLSGKEKSPDPFTLAYILGKEETVARINEALSFLQNHEQ